MTIRQCGLQIGSQVEQQLNALHSTFQIKSNFGEFQSLRIDSEAKVLQACKATPLFKGSINVQSGKGASGRGNNWAYGFRDNLLLEEAIDKYMVLSERTDKYRGCVIIHSLAGGTG